MSASSEIKGIPLNDRISKKNEGALIDMAAMNKKASEELKKLSAELKSSSNKIDQFMGMSTVQWVMTCVCYSILMLMLINNWLELVTGTKFRIQLIFVELAGAALAFLYVINYISNNDECLKFCFEKGGNEKKEV